MKKELTVVSNDAVSSDEASSDDMFFGCSLSDESLRERQGDWSSLGEALLSSEKREGGVTAIYRDDADTSRALASLVEAERACCPHLTWSLSHQDGTIRLDVGPI